MEKGGVSVEVLFENSYTRNKELLKEIYGYHYFKRKSVVVALVALALCFVANIVVALLGDAYNIEFIIIIPLFFAFHVYLYNRQVYTVLKRDQEVHGKEITVQTIVTNDFIQNTSSTGSVNKLEYNKIKKAVQTKGLILLLSDAKLFYIFKKDSFTVGNKEEFISFLKYKGVKIK